MKIRIVISQPLYRRVESFRKPLDPRRRALVRRQFRKCRVQPLHSFEKGRQSLLIEHHQSPVASHFPTATPYPIAPPSVAIPAVPPLLRPPARALAESFALHPRSIRFSCSSG